MKAHLMYPDGDFHLDATLPYGSEELVKDLELGVLFDAMAAEDAFVRKAARTGVLSSLTDLETINYRQGILADCMNNPRDARSLYDLIVDSIEGEREARFWGYAGRFPSSILSGAINVMAYYVGELRKLRDRAAELGSTFASAGFTNLCTMLALELGDDYLAAVEHHLKELEFRRGVLISAELGEGTKGNEYLLRRPNEDDRPWIERMFAKKPESYTYTVPDRDEAGARALSELRDRGLNSVANALAQSVDHVRSFYAMLRTELAFYIGCLNLQEQLTSIGEPICLPEASQAGSGRRSFGGLYDVCLALTAGKKVVGNDIDLRARALVIITGANHGGKSTFLRSIGVSQLMLQCGMFVGARSYAADLCSALFTHFKRQEDAAMESGKFDEELKRMSEISDQLVPNSLMLFNESFSATNEREGSEIARQVVKALVENGVTVFFVTHQYDFARSMHVDPPASSRFLRAERNPDGTRSYKLVEGEPLETSFGRDLYVEVFEGGRDGRVSGSVAPISGNSEEDRPVGSHTDRSDIAGEGEAVAGLENDRH